MKRKIAPKAAAARIRSIRSRTRMTAPKSVAPVYPAQRVMRRDPPRVNVRPLRRAGRMACNGLRFAEASMDRRVRVHGRYAHGPKEEGGGEGRCPDRHAIAGTQVALAAKRAAVRTSWRARWSSPRDPNT